MSASRPILLAPASEDEAAAAVRDAVSAGRKLGLVGGGTRRGLGRPVAVDAELGSSSLTGISFYEPAELVIGVRAGTQIREVEAALAAEGQALAFEPIDHRALLGSGGEPTVGGVAAVNASGPRRVAAGAARDALLGARFVNGKGELIKAGGRVMKNVTGLDLVKALCGAHGTLGFMTEVAFKVLPRAERSVTLILEGLSDDKAIAALAAALGSPYEPAGAAHLPAGIGGTTARTIVRIEGFAESVRHRFDGLATRLAAFGDASEIENERSASLWREVRDAAFLAEPREAAVWRVSTVPGKAPELIAAITDRLEARWFYDWSGGLVWLATEAKGDAGAEAIRASLVDVPGHATLVRGSDALRRKVPVFQPLPSPLMRLSAGLKRSFDPHGVFQPGRMYADI